MKLMMMTLTTETISPMKFKSVEADDETLMTVLITLIDDTDDDTDADYQ